MWQLYNKWLVFLLRELFPGFIFLCDTMMSLLLERFWPRNANSEICMITTRSTKQFQKTSKYGMPATSRLRPILKKNSR